MAGPQLSVEILCPKTIHEFSGGVLGGVGELKVSPSSLWNFCWSLPSPPKMSFFLDLLWFSQIWSKFPENFRSFPP